MKRLAVVLLLLAATSFAADRVQFTLNTSEAEAVLAIADKQAGGKPVLDADWQQLFASEPYLRLKKREASMHRDFTDDDFKRFVLSPELGANAAALRRTLEEWKKADLKATAGRILPYLPSTAMVRAKVYPMIKPQHNSFVFETTSADPAIFLYLDPKTPQAEFENIVAHESHHIGFADAGRQYDERIKALPEHAQQAAEWMGAFGEGLAVLAAAGSVDVHPMRDFANEDRVRWDLDMKYVDRELDEVNQFFTDTVDGGFANPEVANHVGMIFMGYRGPWYTVGYQMGSLIEKRYGRAVLIECMADPRQLLATYNQLAQEQNAGGRAIKLPLWNPKVLEAVKAEVAAGAR